MMPKINDLSWNVYNQNFNEREIEVFNVFLHTRFQEDVEKLLKKKLSRDEFSEELKHLAMYYFWSKCEYEVVITSWPPYITKEELARLNEKEVRVRTDVYPDVGEKIDVYDQLSLNWDKFVDYVYAASKGGKQK